MGDSLTEGLGVDPRMAYPAQLERRLRAEGFGVEVINAGNSGETSSGALSRMDWVLSLSPDVVILATGGNDGLRGIDVGVTEQNIARMVERFQAEEILVILAGMEMVQNMGQVYTDAFRAIYPTLSAQYDIPLIPFLLEGVATDPTLNQPDFIHPNADGYTVVVETVYPYVVAVVERLGE
jgi:acyl-CoA thioesterase-1